MSRVKNSKDWNVENEAQRIHIRDLERIVDDLQSDLDGTRKILLVYRVITVIIIFGMSLIFLMGGI